MKKWAALLLSRGSVGLCKQVEVRSKTFLNGIRHPRVDASITFAFLSEFRLKRR